MHQYHSSVAIAFEREKNLKASVYTAFICGVLALLLFFAKFSLPQIPPVPIEEGIEVNLGNSETGFGDEAPQMPGDPALENNDAVTAPPISQAATSNQNIDAVESDEDAPIVNNNKKITPQKNNDNNTLTKKTAAETNKTPPPPKPKAVYAGGAASGTGGNNADSYNRVTNQGVVGGNGDQGNPNGNPNSDSYTGNASRGSGGVSIRSGLDGRRFTKLPSFEDDFNENAKVAVDITVDKNGNVTAAIINPKGTTTTNQNIRNIAIRKARSLKLNAANDEQTGTIVFDFKLKG